MDTSFDWDKLIEIYAAESGVSKESFEKSMKQNAAKQNTSVYRNTKNKSHPEFIDCFGEDHSYVADLPCGY